MSADLWTPYFPDALTHEECLRATQAKYCGRPLAGLSKPELIRVCLEMNDLLGQMTRHMQAQMQPDIARQIVEMAKAH